MSWIKRRGQAASPNPSSAPPVQMYNPNQHSNLQPQWQQQDLQPAANNWYTQNQPNPQKSQQGDYWQQPYNQPVGQTYNQNQYNQQYAQYGQPQTGYYENNSYQQQNYPGQQAYNYSAVTPNHMEQTQPQADADTWNWGWGDEDNSNVQSMLTVNSNANTNQTAKNPVESFATDEAWNWSVENPNNTNTKNNGEASNVDSFSQQNIENKQDCVFPKIGKLADKHNQSPDSLKDNNELKTTVNQVLVPTSAKHKADILTPQWSTESQLSQDSSDLLESDKSHMLSRSSTISESPISGHDANPEVFANRQDAAKFETYNTLGMQDLPPKPELNAYYKQDNYNPQHENKEVLSNLKEEVKTLKTNPTPPPPLKNHTPPLLPPPSSSDDSRNPYKRSSVLSHKAANKYKSDGHQQGGFYLPNYPVSSSPFNQSVNLETLPDNSEQPDSLPQQTQPRKVSTSKTPVQQWPENNEIAPINDRNQYLETGQLSNNDPPPGFTRMVLGQMEQTDNSVGNQDEPPPGLSRMVLGQTGNSSASDLPVGLHRMVPGESSSPEVSIIRPMPAYGDGDVSESENQPAASQVRSATIGADTPPVTATNLVGSTATSSVVNRSETIGADQPLPYSSTSSDTKKSNNQVRSASSSYNSNIRETNADGANNLDETVANPPVSNRRDSIEGQPQDTSTVANLVNSIRDLTVGENTTDGANSTLSIPDRTTRRSSRQESTDSEHEHENRAKLPKERKDRRYHDKHDQYEREKGRSSRYSPSPDQYRDKNHDRRKYRDKRYEEDTDYYSDKEKDRRRDKGDNRKEEFDKKYSSLKRDKDKDRKRRDQRSHRDYGRDGRRNEYYNRYDEDYEESTRSRPSSRSDSMHDSYRQDRDRPRDRHRRHRDPFNPYMQGYGYDPYNPYYQQYQYHYYENLRRTNPQAYAEWYRKYYQQSGAQQGYGNEDRASVHSGRSSANDDLTKDRYAHQSYYSQSSLNYYREPHTHSISGHYGLDESRPFDQTESSLYLEETTAASQRLTPAKFATAHVKASISSGHLVKIFPHYPLDGQAATVEINNLHDLLNNDDEYKELVEFPGPLVKGVTHKKTIIEYCENKIRSAIYSRDIIDVDSYILMWELLILLLRQNGMVVGTDIAELLMKDRKLQTSRRTSVVSNSSSVVAEPSEGSNVPVSETHSSSTSVIKEEVVTNKFRDYLLYGSEKEALEWAMKHGLWGHALFLASKLDKRTYANVMTRFANGLPMNDPLQTLYQLLSGKVPAAVTSVADDKWGDWRPHLAMILSNTTPRPELDRKAITTLADTLLNRGSLYAAQFCYLMAQVGFSRYNADGAKLVLLGSNHTKPFLEFSVNEAIHMTEVYEYACSLNDASFLIPEFQPYKYLLATRLADRGLLEKSLAYLEKVSLSILQNPSLAQPSLVSQVYELADRLKYCDPVEDHFEGDGDLDNSRPDNSWLQDLKVIERDYSMGLITHDSAENFATETPELDPSQGPQAVYDPQVGQDSWQQQYLDPQQYQQQWQTSQFTEQQPQVEYQQHQQSQDAYGNEQYQDQQQYWSNQQPQQQWGETQEQPAANQQQENVEQLSQNNYWNNTSAQQEEVEKQPEEDIPLPQISMPNQLKGRSIYDEPPGDTTDSTKKSKVESPLKHKPQQQDKAATTGWFGGIWNKLSLRPKNQMKLPDDKNPTIVWDENKKKWINLDADGDAAAAELKPPPKMSDMFPIKQQQPAAPNPQPEIPQQTPTIPSQPMQASHLIPSQNSHMMPNQNNHLMSNQSSHQNGQTAATQPAPADDMMAVVPTKSYQPNMFKLQRGRNVKKAYVDVFNPGNKPTVNAATLPAPDAFGAVPNNGPQINYFVPAPVTDPNAPMDFLTPAPIQHPDDNTQPMYQPQ